MTTVSFRSAMRPSLLLVWLVGCTSCLLPALRAADPPAAPAVAAALTETSYLEEVSRHLYRWYIDEADLEKLTDQPNFIFWVRMLQVPLDAGDHSQFAEIVVPQIKVSVKVKRTDYLIEDLGLTVANPVFKIINVARTDPPATPPPEYQVVNIARQQMVEHLFRTRNQRDYPDDVLKDQLRIALLKQFAAEGTDIPRPPHKLHLVYVSPLSPVANELWAYWESGRMLLHYTSDLDLSNPAVLANTPLSIHTYKMDNQVVVSNLETPGSNAYLTRAQVGRTLYNCLVLGLRVEIPDFDNPPPSKSSPIPTTTTP